MNHHDYFTGESTEGSPALSSQNQNNMMQYNISADQRQQMLHAQFQYNNQPLSNQQQFPYGNTGNQFMMNNFGYNNFNQNSMNPPMNNFGQQQGGIIQGNGFNGFAGNPAFAYMQQMGIPQQNQYMMPNQYYNPIPQDRVVNVPGFDPSGSTMMLPSDIEEVCSKLQSKMMEEQDEAIAKRQERFQGYFNNNSCGYNYYGMPYMSFEDQSVTAKYTEMIEDIKQKAIQKRTDINKHLSRLVHNCLNDGVTAEQIDAIYDGYTYTVPGVNVQNQMTQDRLSRMVPVSNQQFYANHYCKVQEDFSKIVDPHANMQEFLRAQGVIQVLNNLEDEMHRRRDGTRYYQPDAYRRYLRNAVIKRDGKDPYANSQPQQENQSMFPTLSGCGNITDDGTLSITAPAWLSSKEHIQFNNELEQHYQENRSKFLESIYNSGGGN